MKEKQDAAVRQDSEGSLPSFARFLEVNPSGEFCWLERAPGLPVSDALADLLLGHAPRRLPASPDFKADADISNLCRYTVGIISGGAASEAVFVISEPGVRRPGGVRDALRS